MSVKSLVDVRSGLIGRVVACGLGGLVGTAISVSAAGASGRLYLLFGLAVLVGFGGLRTA
jgi:MYXO-CTERM domain-containing protein